MYEAKVSIIPAKAQQSIYYQLKVFKIYKYTHKSDIRIKMNTELSYLSAQYI